MSHLSVAAWIATVFFITYAFSQQCDQSSNVARFDCFPENDATQDKCEARKCCWRSPVQQENATPLKDVNVPSCYYPSDFPAYQVTSNQTTDFGQRFQIVKSQSTYMPNDILSLTVDLIYETAQRLRIKIYDPANKRYEVPLAVPNVTRKVDMSDYDVAVKSNPFAIEVTRKSTGATLFDSSVAPLIFADQFLKFSTRLSSPLLYGLGEHEDPLLMNLTRSWKRLTFWTRDVPPSPNTNLYGDHPFHMNLELNQTGPVNIHGQFLLNSNAMDVDLQPLPALTYTTIGGIIDLYVFTGPTVHDVLEQYWQVIGAPMLPPYWSLGFHLCRYGYRNIDNLKATIQRMHDANFPYDVQWTDIDTMSNHLDFTYDSNSFRGLPDLVRTVQAGGQHYVPIIDPGISSTQPAGSYPSYDEGIKRGIFIKKANADDPIIGRVWPGDTAFPDFTHPNATQWWTDMAAAYHDVVPFDGIWIDMNEPSNFVDGAVDGCTSSSLDNPPFTPHVLGGGLSSKTLCPSARQYLSQHYNLHNMFGYFESIASNLALTTIRKKRPFVLSRSTFVGSGGYTAHWTGDNHAAFDQLYDSISTILSFNMFGVTQVGADICGFGGDTTEELCTRWMQLGAFYPFMRNHNDYGAKDQDPAVFSKDAQQSMKKALLMRYTLAPYWYTRYYEATAKSRPIVQPLFFQYTNDSNTYSNDQQFLVGAAVLVSPNLASGTNTVHAYFPQDAWYEFPSGAPLTTVGQFVDLDTPIDKINVHLRGGHVIPTQTPGANLMLGRSNAFQLLVALSSTGSAFGNLYWDDGDSLDSLQSNKYNYFEFNVTSTNTLTINALMSNYKDTPMTLDTVTVFGLSKTVNAVTVNGQSYTNFHYNSTVASLEVYGLSLNLLSQASQTIQWTTAN